MTRGKYAAKAAGQRAAAANETAESLKAQLADERATSAREITDLKAEVQRLAGQLTTAVKTMAAAEVERVQAEATAQVETERNKRVERALAIAEVLNRNGVHLPADGYADIADALDVSMGEFLGASAKTRAARRSSAAKARYVAALKDRGLGLSEIIAGPPGR